MTIEVLAEQDESFESLVTKLQARDSEISEADVQTSLRILDQSFFKKGTDKHYGPPIINIKHQGKQIQLSEHFKKNMQNKAFRAHLDDLMQLAHYKHINHYHNSNSLQLYQKYSRKDFVRIMNWQNDESATVYGYKQKYQTLPVFITYHKKEDISETTAYEDEFLNQDELKWFTRSNRSLKSPEVQNVIHHQELETPMYMFVKKEDADGKNFYYLGTACYMEGTAEDAQMPDGKNVVTMHLAMDTPVRDDVYRYLVEK
ncbi:putative helicase [Staphylococcus piscifermentans]|uniref:Uncharacterized protein n=1 Tax=Staphylococcus piscifermentans TaxID=70258 RepID=A0A239TL17_9STAP|nr:hypothetical protein SPI02_10790 [Staphylococcus piscifermentans]SNU97908.1 putative helicase [Staphylococcus piscifermentans]